jgi:hypothetical protein
MIIVNCIITMRSGLKNWAQIKCINSQRIDMVYPGGELLQAGIRGRCIVVIGWCAAKSQWVNMIKDGVVSPVFHFFPLINLHTGRYTKIIKKL